MATYYRSSTEIEGKRLSYGDILVFSKEGEFENVGYSVHFRCLTSNTGNNDEIFDLLQVTDPEKFAENCYGYKPNAGVFPECEYRDYEALTRIAIALFKLCEGEQDTSESAKEYSPLYNVGDRVIIKSKYDPGCSDGDYGLFFTERMLREYGGQTVTISSVRPMNREYIGKRKLYTEPYIYDIVEDSGYWNWDASMFSGKAVEILVKPKSTSSSKISTTKKSTKTNKTIQSTMEKKSIFAGFIEKYKAQFIPEKDESLKLSMDGKVCALVGDEYVGIDENNELISYPAEMCLDFPIYLIAKPYSQVEVGDIIKINRSYVKVLKKNPNKSLSCLTFSGYTQNKKEVKDFILGQAFVKTVVNMFGNMKAGGFNPMMLALANGEMNAKDLLIMQMFQGGVTTQANQMNPMLMMALIDKGEDSSMLEAMMMMQMMGGQFPNPFIPNDKK